MTLQYLIDTDWVIHYLNDNPEIIQQLEALRDQGLGLSVISLAELYEGIFSSTNPTGNEQGLNDFLRGVTVLGIDEATCQIFGKERGRLRAAGQRLGDFDLLIGATALRRSLTLLTNNRRHFELIEDLQLLSV